MNFTNPEFVYPGLGMIRDGLITGEITVPEYEPVGESRPSPYIPAGASGGGGQGGNYVFTDLAHLDSMIARWTSIRGDVAVNGSKIDLAIEKVVPPADDDPSVRQATTYIKSLQAAWEHNDKIVRYATGYIDKLQAARNHYAATEQGNTDRLNNADNT